MPHIPLPSGLPGIRGPMAFRPETAKPINELANILLHEPHSLPRGERELIATYVSSETDSRFCQTVHGAFAAHYHGGDEALVVQVKADPERAIVSPKMKALLNIARKVAVNGKLVTSDDVARARTEGATDLEIHDTVLIAALFCLCNRYVDGLETDMPESLNYFRERVPITAAQGYHMPPAPPPAPVQGQ